jgi:hypothetical protein
MDTCIALRTAVVKDGVMHVQAGGGVVADSDPEGEFQESCNKARALIRAAQEAVGLPPSAAIARSVVQDSVVVRSRCAAMSLTGTRQPPV